MASGGSWTRTHSGPSNVHRLVVHASGRRCPRDVRLARRTVGARPASLTSNLLLDGSSVLGDSCYGSVAGWDASMIDGRTRIAITGASGFVGRHLVDRLLSAGQGVVPISRQTGFDLTRPDRAALDAALQGCDAVVHCAGINRELGSQTSDAVHVRE